MHQHNIPIGSRVTLIRGPKAGLSYQLVEYLEGGDRVRIQSPRTYESCAISISRLRILEESVGGEPLDGDNSVGLSVGDKPLDNIGVEPLSDAGLKPLRCLGADPLEPVGTEPLDVGLEPLTYSAGSEDGGLKTMLSQQIRMLEQMGAMAGCWVESAGRGYYRLRHRQHMRARDRYLKPDEIEIVKRRVEAGRVLQCCRDLLKLISQGLNV